MPPTSKKLEGHFAFGVSVCSSCFLMHSITSESACYCFEISYMDSSWKIADTYFFSWQDYAPFLSYGPLKKYGCNIVSKISQKQLKLESWNLTVRLSGLDGSDEWMTWLTFELILKNTSWVMALCNFGQFYLVSKMISKTVGARALKLGELIGNDE